MAFTFIAAAAHGSFVSHGLSAAALAFGAALGICATAHLFAFLHGGFHVLVPVFAFATRLAIFCFALVSAARCAILGIGCGMMAATLAVFHVSHVVMAASLCLLRW